MSRPSPPMRAPSRDRPPRRRFPYPCRFPRASNRETSPAADLPVRTSGRRPDRSNGVSWSRVARRRRFARPAQREWRSSVRRSSHPWAGVRLVAACRRGRINGSLNRLAVGVGSDFPDQTPWDGWRHGTGQNRGNNLRMRPPWFRIPETLDGGGRAQ